MMNINGAARCHVPRALGESMHSEALVRNQNAH